MHTSRTRRIRAAVAATLLAGVLAASATAAAAAADDTGSDETATTISVKFDSGGSQMSFRGGIRW